MFALAALLRDSTPYKLHVGSFVIVHYCDIYEIWIWIGFTMNSKQ